MNKVLHEKLKHVCQIILCHSHKIYFNVMMLYIRIVIIFFLCLGHVAYADSIEHDVQFNLFDHSIFENQQRDLAEKHQEHVQSFEVLNYDIFNDENMRLYSYTAYEFDAAKNKFLAGDLEHISMQDFFISFGYGMEYRLNRKNSVGYEYLSNFPYDRGQMIRLFWNYIF